MLSSYLIVLTIILIGLIISATSYNKLIRTYNKYNTFAFINMTASQFVVGAFDFLNLPNHKIAISRKPLSDGYLINKKIVILSEQNFHSKTISAIAVAAHEIGHVMQHKEGNKLFAIHFLFNKLSKIADFLLFPSLVIGGSLILFSSEYLILGNTIFYIGAFLYLASLFFKIITIPLEYNASKRALNLLKRERLLDAEELKGAKKVLRAAALTYIGSIFNNLLRFLKGVGNSFK